MNYCLTLEYYGQRFHGWQIQPGRRTVQGELTRALEIIFKEKITLYAAGRTDAGVHARDQVVNFKTAVLIAPEKVSRQLNGILGHDIAILSSEIVPDSFHARYSAIAREYEYIISEKKSALSYHRCWEVPLQRPMKELNPFLSHLMGKHSFRSFCPVATDMPNFDCEVERVYWEQQGFIHIFTIKSNRFLHNMVRVIVGTCHDIMCDKFPVDHFEKLLVLDNRMLAGKTAPPQGLYLKHVYYP